MSHKPSARITKHPADLTDPRRREVTHPLINIVTIALRAVIGGADDLVTIASWAQHKRSSLARLLGLRRGIPSHGRFNATSRALDPAEFERCLLGWVTSPHEITAGRLVAIDGKSPRQGFDAATSQSAINRAGAWATANQIGLGQVVVAGGSNEITAIPELLEILEVAGALVTIDAMGCRAKIAAKIVEKKASYVLAVRRNQPTSLDGTGALLPDHTEDDLARVKASRHQTSEHGHGRDEVRACFVCDVPRDLRDRCRREGLKRIGVAIGDAVRGGKACHEMRHSIVGKRLSTRSFGTAVQGCWGVENSCHWQLDVSFGGTAAGRMIAGRDDDYPGQVPFRT